MRYETYISNIKEYSYRYFRELYGHIKYDLGAYGAIAEMEGDKHTVEAYHDLIEQAFNICRSYLGDIHLEDDEYGTYAYTGYCRTYREAADRFIADMERIMHCKIDFVTYDGEINSVVFRGFNPDDFCTYSDWRRQEEEEQALYNTLNNEDEEV